MTEPFVAGTMRSTPVRVHMYASRGVFMLVDKDNIGCWSDPQGRVLLPSLEIVDRVLKAHGYVRQDMLVTRAPGNTVEAPIMEPMPEDSVMVPESPPDETQPAARVDTLTAPPLRRKRGRPAGQK